VSTEYAAIDHELRESDAYGQGKYRITLRWLADCRRGSLLYNVGCGGGLFNRMAVDAGFRVEAFEPDRVAFELARRDSPQHDCAVHRLGVGEIEGERIADVIVMHDVLEHIEDDTNVIERLRQLLVQDGVLVLSVPALPALFGFHDEQLGHYRRYMRRSLRHALSQQFDILHLRYYGLAFLPVTAYYSRFRRRPYPTPASESGLMSAAFRAVCAVEGRVPMPIGTSLICLARPRISGTRLP
jgi:2-polyprenyl-3-methyl-5-hydroxy-6-metoxy-1,4-benzoquinol methylase